MKRTRAGTSTAEAKKDDEESESEDSEPFGDVSAAMQQ